MGKIIITTDITADLPKEYIDKYNIGILPMSFVIDGKEYDGDSDSEFDIKEFYNDMRSGKMPTTSQVNPVVARKKFEEYLKEGYDVLHIAFSSALSGSYNNARLVAEELAEEYDNKIVVIDSLCASMGEGLYVHKAVKLREEGKSLDEIVEWLEENKLNMCHYFTVDDLNHLYRGGRVSRATAILGTMIGVKPVLHVDNEGRLIPISKVRGRKQSLNALVKYMKELIGNFENDIVFISHGDAQKDAEYVASLIKKEIGIDSFLINHIGPTVGAHSGPGTIALFFMGEKR